MSGTKGIRQIQEAINEHSDASLTRVGKSRISIGRWIATVTAVAIVSTIALTSGAVISGEAQAQSYSQSKTSQGGMMRPLQVMPSVDLSEGAYRTKPVQEVARPSVDIPAIEEAFLDTAVDVIRYNSGMSYEEAAEVMSEMIDAVEFAVEQGKSSGRLVFHSHGVTLNYNDPVNPVLTAYYGPRAMDGRPDLVGKHGAVQRVGKVEVFNGSEHYIHPKTR